MDYPVETFTDEERALLAPHFTNLDRPVFALVNLPETVKGALFARYSRYQGTLRRLYLEEFAANRAGRRRARSTASEGERARKLYERIFIGYGDDSVAQLGGAHIACEWVSNVMTKLLQRGRLAAYLEQSTRYMPYDAPIGDGLGYRYWRHPELGPEYEAAMDFLFDSYSEALPRVEAWAAERFPRGDDEPEAAHARSIRAKALDLLRGLLPAASLSHVGHLRLGPGLRAAAAAAVRLAAAGGARLREHDPRGAEGGGAELRRARGAARPRRRVDRATSRSASSAGERWAARLGLDRATRDEETGPAVRLLSVAGERGGAARRAAVRGRRRCRRTRRARRCATCRRTSARRCWPSWSASARNRRHRPGRGFEALRYRFEVVSDYGAFRDLQRHRLLTVQWQTLGPELGAGVPDELDEAGVGDLYRAGLERSREEYARIAEPGHPELAPLRARARLPDPLRARHERARGDAPDRAALRPRGPPRLPRRRARAARGDRARASRGRGHDDVRGPRHRAAARADPVRDPRAREAGRTGLSCAPQLASPRTVRGAPTDQGGCPSERSVATGF